MERSRSVNYYQTNKCRLRETLLLFFKKTRNLMASYVVFLAHFCLKVCRIRGMVCRIVIENKSLPFCYTFIKLLYFLNTLFKKTPRKSVLRAIRWLGNILNM